MFNEKDQLAVNALRALSIEQIEKANSGHPGLPMGAAPMAYALWAGHLNINPEDSNWINRDRFVLSAGHGSALLYSLLHLSGFDVTTEDLKNFRQMDSRTPGHPEVHFTDGVEATTGPLGQGFATAVGMAMAEEHLAALYNKEDQNIIDHYTYVLASDGDLMEGISYEAASFAGKHELGKLVVLYDSNDISLDGDLELSFVEDIQGRFEAQNWHYQRVEDGNDLNAVSDAIQAAKENTSQPSLIEVKTVIGYGSANEGTHSVHGAPLGSEDWEQVKEVYGWKSEAFEVPEEVKQTFSEKVKERGQKAYTEWAELFGHYQESNKELAEELMIAYEENGLPEDYDSQLEYVSSDTKAAATRESSSSIIQDLAEGIPYLWGGSADLASSNKTNIKVEDDFMPDNRVGRNIWFGVREHAMAAMMNGIALHGGTKIYGGTFFIFSDYLKPAVRIAAISQLPVTYVLTHDSVAVGEDGPTHEPIEQLATFRATPNLNVIRPADYNETLAAWKLAVNSKDQPTMLVLTRQGVPVLENTQDLAEEGVAKGAYIVSEAEGEAEGILIATGSEVSLAVEAQALLKEKGRQVNVVSIPSMELFEEQDEAYKESILPSALTNRVTIEMGATYGWERYAGDSGAILGIDRFGKSAPGSEVVESFGFTPENVANIYLEKFAE